MPRTREKRSFATIEQLPSKRWRVRYTGPDGARHSAAHLRHPDRRRGVRVATAPQDRPRTTGTPPTTNPEEHDHVRRLRGPLAGEQAGGRPTDQGPHPRALPARSWTTHLLPTFGARQLAAIKPKDVREWYEATLVDRPTMRSARLQPAAHHHGVARSTRAASTPTRAGSSALGAPSGSTRSGRQSSPNSRCSPRRCPSGCD